MSIMSIFRIIFGSIYVLFIPGFLLTFIFFELKEKQIDWLTRIVISFALSIAVIPLFVFLSNLIGISITTLNVFLEILLIIFISSTWILFSKSTYYKKILKKLKK